MIFLLILVVLVSFSACNNQSQVEPLDGEITDLADEFLNHMEEGDFELATEYFDVDMRNALSEVELSETWRGLQNQLGTYYGKVGERTEEIQEYDIVFITVQFEYELIDIRIVFNEYKQIAGLFFEPRKQESEGYIPPDYADSDNFIEKEVTIGEGKWELPGTLTLPNSQGPFPAIVLVHGSGPNDRDQTIGPNKPFKDLAWGLANKGIAVLRYDKRTMIYGQELANEGDLTVNEEAVEDALLAVELLEDIDNIDTSEIYVLGHSLGGMLAPRIADGNKNINGLIIMAGTTRALEDLYLMQIKYIAQLDGEISNEESVQIDLVTEQVANIKDPSLSKDTPSSKLLGIPASYWLDLRGYDPGEIAKSLSIPILILQGEADYQVTMEDFQLWKETLEHQNNVELKSYPRLNHLFIEGDIQSRPEDYEKAGNVSEEVINNIANWIKK